MIDEKALIQLGAVIRAGHGDNVVVSISTARPRLGDSGSDEGSTD